MYFPIHTPSFVFSFLGTILNTGMHNVEGGYENDCSVARLAYNRYMLMSPSIQQMRSFTWVKHHLPEDGSVFLQVFSIEHILIPYIILEHFINHSIQNLFLGCHFFVHNTLHHGTEISRGYGKSNRNRS